MQRHVFCVKWQLVEIFVVHICNSPHFLTFGLHNKNIHTIGKILRKELGKRTVTKT